LAVSLIAPAIGAPDAVQRASGALPIRGPRCWIGIDPGSAVHRNRTMLAGRTLHRLRDTQSRRGTGFRFAFRQASLPGKAAVKKTPEINREMKCRNSGL
jgi:hypothetical protein